MVNLYFTLQETILYGVALAGIVAGFRIYQKWQRGEPVVPLIYTWIFGLLLAMGLQHLVYILIVSGGISGYTPITIARSYARETHSATMVIGVVVAIIAIIHIYYKHNAGDDVTELVYRWVGSLFFLFSMGLIIETVMTSWSP